MSSSSYPLDQGKSLSRVQLFETPWTVACQAPPSMEFSRQGYWSRLPFPYTGDLPDPGIEPGSSTLHQTHLLATMEGSYLLFYPKKELRKMLLEMLGLSTFYPHGILTFQKPLNFLSINLTNIKVKE